MRSTRYDTRGGRCLGDMATWLRENGEDNEAQMSRLRRGLRQAREKELTPRQQEVLRLYFDECMTIPQIAGQLGLNRSTISRTLQRAKDRLYRALRYTL